MRKLRPFLIAVAVGLPGALAGAGAAHAALPWVPCSPTGFQCTTFDVPVDRSGATKGTIKLSARRALAPAGDGSTAVVALAGGPGQAAQPIAAGFKEALAPLLGTRDLLVYDQRGTGLSNPLRCAGLSSPGSLVTRVSTCAQQLGPARAYYTTSDSVQDIEAMRVAGGYSRLVLYGVSYGTKVALAYAAAHPATTAALVLDSVVTPEGPDALRRSSLAAVPRALGDDLCGSRACTGITGSVVADVTKLAGKLGAHTLTGPVLDGRGRAFRARLSVDGLLGILIAGDLDPTLRAELPGSLRAALTGDVKPILRLSARSAGLENAARFQQAAADNDPLFFTTLCEETTSVPWTRGGTLSGRIKEAEARIKALPSTTFSPFPRSVALGGVPSLCVGWPVASAAPAAPGALPDVPVLVLDGLSDLRTPVEDAKAVAAHFPRAQVVAVPHSGHSVLGTEPGTCAKDALAAFAAGAPVVACPAIDNPYYPTPRPPLSLAKVKAARGFTPKIGRTINAVTATLTDARRQVIGRALGSGRLPSAVGGLRRGYVKVSSIAKLALRGYEYVPGVRVTGTYSATGTTTVVISGTAAAHGRLTFSKGGTSVKGTLGGRKVSASRSRSARLAPLRDGLPTLAAALAQGRLAAAGG
jgi:pimeloyl-ACP methyl ester carboxylesterase